MSHFVAYDNTIEVSTGLPVTLSCSGFPWALAKEFYPSSTHYDPTLLGHPHRVASPQPTESFWQQLPEVSGQTYTAYDTTSGFYHPFHLTPATNMGNKMKRSGPLFQTARDKTAALKAQEQARQRSTPSTARPVAQYVDVYVGDVFVKSTTRRAGSRFSRTIARAFPKPTDTDQQTTGTETAVNGNKIVRLCLEGAPKSLTAQSVEYCLNWIELNNGARGIETIQDFYVPTTDSFPLTDLVDIYAAATTLKLWPNPDELRVTIYDRLTRYAPLQADVEYIFNHLSLMDGVVTRTITAHFEHKEQGNYTDEDQAHIFDYVNSVPGLEYRFYDIQESRKRYQARQASKQKNVRKGQKTKGDRSIAEGSVGGEKTEKNGAKGGGKEAHNGGNAGKGAAVVNAGGAVAAVAMTTTEAKKLGNGRGVGGRHVPGA